MGTALGSSSATQTAIADEWNQQTGRIIEKTWEGTRNQILALRNDLERDAESYHFSSDGLKWSAHAKFVWEAPQFEVRVESREVHQDIFRPDTVPQVSVEDLAKIHAQVINPDPSFAISDLSSAAAYDLYHLYLMGVRSKKVFSQFVILHITASAFYNFGQSYSYANVGNIQSTGQMVAESGADITRIPLMTSGSFESADGDPVFNWGWLKHPPDCTRTTQGKRLFIAQWEFNLWPQRLYPLAAPTE